MPFDGTPNYEIECIKRVVRQARAKGRLICDNPEKFERTEVSTDLGGGVDLGGIVYVCAVGAWEEVTRRNWYESARTWPVRKYAHLLMQAHDELFAARKAGRTRAIVRAEKTFNALLA